MMGTVVNSGIGPSAWCDLHCPLRWTEKGRFEINTIVTLSLLRKYTQIIDLYRPFHEKIRNCFHKCNLKSSQSKSPVQAAAPLLMFEYVQCCCLNYKNIFTKCV